MQSVPITLRRHVGAAPVESSALVAAVQDAIAWFYLGGMRPETPGYRSSAPYRRRQRKRSLAALDRGARDRFLTVIGRAFSGMRLEELPPCQGCDSYRARVLVTTTRSRRSYPDDEEWLTVYQSVLGPFCYWSLESGRVATESGLAADPSSLMPYLRALEQEFASIAVAPLGELALCRVYGVFPEATDPEHVLVFHCLLDERVEGPMIHDAYVGGQSLRHEWIRHSV